MQALPPTLVTDGVTTTDARRTCHRNTAEGQPCPRNVAQRVASTISISGSADQGREVVILPVHNVAFDPARTAGQGVG